MRQRYRLYRRKNGGRYYIHDDVTGKQESLGTSDRAIAVRLFHSKSEAVQQPAVNLQIARAYLAASDPQIATRTGSSSWTRWSNSKGRDPAPLADRHQGQGVQLDPASADFGNEAGKLFARARNRKSFDQCIFAAHPQLRPGHDMAAVAGHRETAMAESSVQRQTRHHWEEHQAIVTRELNPERKAFYKLAWHMGASQSDLANLEAENIDWEHNVISFARKRPARLPSCVST